MRASIPEELLDTIVEKIYLDLEIHILEKKHMYAETQKKDEEHIKFLKQVISSVRKKRKEIGEVLKGKNVKIYEVVELDDMFVEYTYAQKTNGASKEGTQRFWKAGLKYRLTRRINERLTRGVEENTN
ncbi:hypothetical protein [Cytobacillus sp. IB215665]|uniref:hypothetical protein n=1 Tax=Cytobacillus sp. IB215665 TaxID=3097357 RepID=UPI002A17530F|nr:hypothetical protein [Cytobacillus sp. IB215665]MDX8366603.1 hypothetical protein [Cytobacillus sp. IB215665]